MQIHEYRDGLTLASLTWIDPKPLRLTSSPTLTISTLTQEEKRNYIQFYLQEIEVITVTLSKYGLLLGVQKRASVHKEKNKSLPAGITPTGGSTQLSIIAEDSFY
uniref:Uncharacterized protein n=1 Tax=Vespula pensylvanica TaxID=30213 RepID=A0A834P191_VESPE|nr:hypothetical protein H0235_009169 [Vespula pensylvanica]